MWWATRQASLAVIQRRMIGENLLGAAVFNGGMLNIFDEHNLIAERWPEANIFP